MSFDFVDYKKDFPLLMQQDVAYLDSAATAQRPASVLQAEKEFYEQANANPLRGVRSGTVTGTARPLHVGRSTQVWEIRIEDEHGRLVCISRLTLAVVPRG